MAFIGLYFYNNELDPFEHRALPQGEGLETQVYLSRPNVDGVIEHNLRAILTRNAGDHFYVSQADGEKGKLKKVKGFKTWVWYLYHKKAEDKKAHAVVLPAIQEISAFLETHKNTATEAQLRTYRYVLSNLFSEKGSISSLPSKIFDPSTLQKKDLLSIMSLPQGMVRVCYTFNEDKKVYFDVPSKELDRSQPIPFFDSQLYFSNDIAKDNLYTLFTAHKGDKFRAIAITDGEGEDKKIKGYRLEKVSSLFGRIGYAFKNILGGEDKKVRLATQKAFSDWNEQLKQYGDDKNSLKALKVQSYVIRRLFESNPHFSAHALDKGERLSVLALPENTVRLSFCVGDTTKYLDLMTNAFNSLFEQEPVFRLYKMATQSDKDTHNLYKLLKRERMCAYRYDKNSQRLKKVKGDWGHIKYFIFESYEQKKVKRCVNATLASLNTVFEENNNLYYEQNSIYKVIFKHYFFGDGVMARMTPRVYNREAIPETEAAQSLQDFLFPEYKDCQRELIEALIDLRKEMKGENYQAIQEMMKEVLIAGNNQRLDELFRALNANGGYIAAREKAKEALFELVYAEFQLAQKLGLRMEGVFDGGSGGARYVFNRYGEKIMVVKPVDEGPYGVNNPKWYATFKRALSSGPKSLRGNSEPLSETLAEKWQGFHPSFVPPTVKRQVQSNRFIGATSKPSSAQLFVEGCEPIGSFLGLPKKFDYLPRPAMRALYNKLPKNKLVKWMNPKLARIPSIDPSLLDAIALHNYLLGDVDCHFDNMLVKMVNEKELSPVAKLMYPVGPLSEDPPDVSDENIEEFVHSFFMPGKPDAVLLRNWKQKVSYFFSSKKKEKAPLSNQQQLLQSLFTIGTAQERVWKNKQWEYETRKISLIKHDGGSSFTRSHPHGYFETRFRYLFEVLPQFRGKFFPTGFSEQDENFEFPAEQQTLWKFYFEEHYAYDPYCQTDQDKVEKMLKMLRKMAREEDKVAHALPDGKRISTMTLDELKDYIGFKVGDYFADDAFMKTCPKPTPKFGANLFKNTEFYCTRLNDLLYKQLREGLECDPLYEILIDEEDGCQELFDAWMEEIIQAAFSPKYRAPNSAPREALLEEITRQRIRFAGEKNPEHIAVKADPGFFKRKHLDFQKRYIKNSTNFHLMRIEGVIKTSLERWMITQYALRNNLSKRELFKHRGASDVFKILRKIKEDKNFVASVADPIKKYFDIDEGSSVTAEDD